MKISSSGAVLCAFLCAVSALAGDLNPPPGPVAPTMKTLDDVEPRTAINAENTPGDADSVFRIDTPGSYYLSSDVFHGAGESGIEISSSDVVVDLNGFMIEGVMGSLGGVVYSGASAHSVVVRNGTITGNDGGGVVLPQVTNAHIERVDVRSVNGVGIVCGSASAVADCDVRNTLSFGIRVSTGSIFRCTVVSAGSGFACFEVSCCGSIVDCQASGSGGPGFVGQSDVTMERCVATGTTDGFVGAFGGATFRDCNANFCQDDGFEVASPARLTGCVARGCGGYGVNGTGSLVLRDVVADSNTEGGILVGEFSVVEACVATGNGTDVFDNGIEALAGSRISGCASAQNTGSGIAINDGAADGGLISDCTSRMNGGVGFAMNNRCTLRACVASENSFSGYSVDNSTTLIDCSSLENGSDGYFLGEGCLLERCTAAENDGNGFFFFQGSALTGCVAYNNTGNGFDGSSAEIRSCRAEENNGAGIVVRGTSLVVGNSCRSNSGAGIEATGTASSTIDGNTSKWNAIGIDINGTGHIVVRNMAGLNTAMQYDIALGNYVATIQTSPVGAGPWDNFEF